MTAAEQIAAVLAELAESLGCSQCGQPFSHRACGPTHAVIQADPRQHRLLAPLLDAAHARGVADGRAEVEARAHDAEADCDGRGERLWRLAAKAGWRPGNPADNDATAEQFLTDALADRDEMLVLLDGALVQRDEARAAAVRVWDEAQASVIADWTHGYDAQTDGHPDPEPTPNPYRDLLVSHGGASDAEIERPYCLRCEVPIYQDEHGTWRREATGVADCPRNPARDGHEPHGGASDAAMDDFDPVAWSAQQVERHGNALARLLARTDEHEDREAWRILHTAVGQLAQVLRALTGVRSSDAATVQAVDLDRPTHPDLR